MIRPANPLQCHGRREAGCVNELALVALPAQILNLVAEGLDLSDRHPHRRHDRSQSIVVALRGSVVHLTESARFFEFGKGEVERVIVRAEALNWFGSHSRTLSACPRFPRPLFGVTA